MFHPFTNKSCPFLQAGLIVLVWAWVICPMSAEAVSGIRVWTTTKKGTALRVVHGEARYSHPPKVTFEVLKDFRIYEKIFPFMSESGVVGQKGDLPLVKFRFQKMFPVPSLWSTVAVKEYRQGEDRLLSWSLVEGNIRQNRGLVRVVPQGMKEKTSLVRFEVELQPGFPWPQTWVVDAAKLHLPVFLRRLEHHIGKAHRKMKPRPKEIEKKALRFPKGVWFWRGLKKNNL